MRAKIARCLRAVMLGQRGNVNLGGIITFLVLGFVGLTLAFELIPLITALVHAETGIVGALLDIAIWIIPAAVGVGVVMAAVSYVRRASN